MERMSDERLAEVREEIESDLARNFARWGGAEVIEKRFKILLAEIVALRADLAAAKKVISPDDARREANKLMATPEYTNRDHPKHASVVEQVTELFERAYTDLDENSDSWRTRALAAEAKLTAALSRAERAEQERDEAVRHIDTWSDLACQRAEQLTAAQARLNDIRAETLEEVAQTILNDFVPEMEMESTKAILRIVAGSIRALRSKDEARETRDE